MQNLSIFERVDFFTYYYGIGKYFKFFYIKVNSHEPTFSDGSKLTQLREQNGSRETLILNNSLDNDDHINAGKHTNFLHRCPCTNGW